MGFGRSIAEEVITLTSYMKRKQISNQLPNFLPQSSEKRRTN
jgi:hypothetical protein